MVSRWAVMLLPLLVACKTKDVVLPPAAGVTVKNGCAETLWVSQAGFAGDSVVKLAADASVTFTAPAAGLVSTRVWGKLGCDESGNNCAVGQSDPPCPAAGCAPPVDSKVEATWACTLADAGGCALNPSSLDGGRLDGTTWWNASAVDGYTLPFKVEPVNGGANCPAAECSALTLAECPTETIATCDGGTVTRSLAVVLPDGGKGGCYSPCHAITYPTYGGEGCAAPGPASNPYCCPTPPVSPAACSAGPVADAGYVRLIHKACASSVYGYAYDDGTGLRACAGTTHLNVTFGPDCRR